MKMKWQRLAMDFLKSIGYSSAWEMSRTKTGNIYVRWDYDNKSKKYLCRKLLGKD